MVCRQIKKSSSEIDTELEQCLFWWNEVLRLALSELKRWKSSPKSPVFLHCDARSTPPRVAAVAFCDGEAAFFDTAPTAEVMSYFPVRGDNQIMSLELLSIAYGKCC